MMKASTSVAERINYLTSDEDLRQELWVYYLEGNSPDTFEQYLAQLKRRFSEQEAIDQVSQDIIQQPFSRKLSDVLDHFTSVERSVVFMLLLGYTADDISGINNMCRVRARQMIQNIKSNTNWNEVSKNGA